MIEKILSLPNWFLSFLLAMGALLLVAIISAVFPAILFLAAAGILVVIGLGTLNKKFIETDRISLPLGGVALILALMFGLLWYMNISPTTVAGSVFQPKLAPGSVIQELFDTRVSFGDLAIAIGGLAGIITIAGVIPGIPGIKYKKK